MKRLLHNHHLVSLGKRTYLFFALIGGMTLLFSGCLKEKFDHFPDIYVKPGESIQAAVNAAGPGQTIFIKPGTYKEAILVTKKGIHLIGLKGSHNEGVTIENPGTEENGITVRDNANGFVLKNVTVRDFEENGVFLIRVDNFLLDHVITIDNGEYGLFPLFCKNGLIENCSATGHSDTGIYIGQSSNVIMQNNKAYGNVNGFEVENSSDVVVSENESYDNVAGILVILLPGLTVKASSDILLKENYVHHNNHVNFAPPGGGFELFVPKGSGILIVGVDNATVKKNKITNNNFVGVAVVSTLVLGSLAGLPPEAFADIEPNADGAKVTGNVLVSNGSAPPPGLPLPGVDLLWDGTGLNNCWKNNEFSTSFPSGLPACL